MNIALVREYALSLPDVEVPSFPRRREPGGVRRQVLQQLQRHWVPACAGTTGWRTPGVPRGVGRCMTPFRAGSDFSKRSELGGGWGFIGRLDDVEK